MFGSLIQRLRGCCGLATMYQIFLIANREHGVLTVACAYSQRRSRVDWKRLRERVGLSPSWLNSERLFGCCHLKKTVADRIVVDVALTRQPKRIPFLPVLSAKGQPTAQVVFVHVTEQPPKKFSSSYNKQAFFISHTSIWQCQ
jgi:hypothetical protein